MIATDEMNVWYCVLSPRMLFFFGIGIDGQMPIPVAERSKERVYCRSFAGTAGSNRAAGMDVCLL
jgi:hypothetical protein